jgi:acylphosphatase
MRHVKIRVHGKVQGVFFRQSAQEKAEELNVTGWARNEADGSVYMEAEGEDENLQRFLEWCRQGPPAASVSDMEHEFSEELKDFKGFRIEF